MASKGSWGKTQEAMENAGGGTFLRLENDGDKAVVAFCGAPFPRDICFNEKTKQYEAWSDEQKAAGRKKQTKYLMNVYVLSLLGKVTNEMRVIDMNFNTATSLFALKDKYGVSKCFFEIQRHGAKGDTKTQYGILPDVEISADHRAIFGAVDPKDPDGWVEGTAKLHDLEEVATKGGDDESTTVTDDVKKAGGGKKDGASPKSTNGTAAAAGSGAGAPPASTAPASPASDAGQPVITKSVVEEIIGKLKPLDKDKGIVPFLAKFPYAKKVSDIRVADEAAARELAAKLSAPPPPAQEDPFG